MTSAVRADGRVVRELSVKAAAKLLENKASLPEGALSVQQMYTLKKGSLQKIHGTKDEQFGSAIRRLEMLKQCDPMSDIIIFSFEDNMDTMTLSGDPNASFVSTCYPAHRMVAFQIVLGTAQRITAYEKEHPGSRRPVFGLDAAHLKDPDTQGNMFDM